MTSAILRMLLCMYLFASFAVNGAEESNPEQIVKAFQKLPHHELFCKDGTWGDREPLKVGVKFEHHFSKALYKLFIWSQCGKPSAPPPHYQDLDDYISWDIRFGFPFSPLTGSEGVSATNVRVQPAKFRGPDKAVINVLFGLGPPENTITTYTVIREDGKWKIDDIAPQGYTTGGAEPEVIWRGSKSVKTEMQNNYRKAEARYQQELAKKRLGSKP